MAYAVDFSDQAERELKRLSLPARVGVALSAARANPRRPGVRKVVGSDHLYRAKAGDCRIIFAIRKRACSACVCVRVAHRARVYRHMDGLPPGWD